MDFNGQKRIVDYYKKVLSDPASRPAERAKLAEVRRRRIYDSLLTRPVYIPLQFTLNAAGQLTPYRASTPQLGYDVVITGIKTDCWPGAGRDITFSLSDGSQNIARTGNDDTISLRTDDIAGCTVDAGGGQVGVFYWPQPFPLPSDSRITVEMMKTDTTGADEVVNFVLIGYRVLSGAYAANAISDTTRAQIDQLITFRETPQMRVLKIPVNFAAATVGEVAVDLESPRVEEPLLIRGMRTTLRQSTIELGIEGEANWMPSQTPIWAVADENDQGNGNYIWFSDPIFLNPDGALAIRRAINGNIDQLNVDPTTNQIAVICETV